MHRPSPDTLKLGTTVAFLGAASLMGWIGVATVVARAPAERAPGFWTDISAMTAGNLIVTAIIGLLTWVLLDKPSAQHPQRLDL